jgi:hypothetical protein
MSWFSPVTSSSSTNGFSETAPPPTAARGGGQAGPRRPGRRRRASFGAGALTGAGLAVCVAAIVSAPLLAGGVHRGTMIGLMATGLVGLTAWTVGLALQGRAPRMGLVALAPLAFVLVPLLQSVPIPFALRGGLDRAEHAG